jgi:hypothetical protein
MLAWKVVRNRRKLSEVDSLGNFSSRKKALAHLLVVIQNDFSINQRWPDLQQFYDVDVSVERMGKYTLWASGVAWDDPSRRRDYSIFAFRIE